jgi:hypothetical protein
VDDRVAVELHAVGFAGGHDLLSNDPGTTILYNGYRESGEDLVTEGVVQVLAIVPKSAADAWLAKQGESDETWGMAIRSQSQASTERRRKMVKAGLLVLIPHLSANGR